MISRTILVFIFGPLFLCTAASANPQQWQDHESILKVAHQELTNRAKKSAAEIEFKINPLDRRLKLTRCDETLAVFFPSNTPLRNPTTIGVQCNGIVNWKIYLTAHLSIFESVVVSRHALAKNLKITANDVTLRRTETSKISADYFTEASQIGSFQTRKAIAANTVIRLAQLTPAYLVKKGTQVNIISQAGAISVTDRGIALANGTKHQQIRVKNLSSSKIITATVTQEDSVTAH